MSRSIPAKGSVTLSGEERQLRDNGSGRLVFTEYKGRHCALLLQNDRLTAAGFYDPSKQERIGAVYIGKIKNMAENIDACFVEIGGGETCFLPLRKAKAPFLTNRSYDGRLREGDEILVQVEREAQKTKQACVTADILLAPQPASAEISSAEPLAHLRQIALTRSCFSCLAEPPQPWEARLRELASPNEYDRIVTDDPQLYEKLAQYCASRLPEKELRLYRDDGLSLTKLYGLESKLDEALKPKVWLKSGGFLVIEPTEAMTVIDVNSGKNETGAKYEALRRINLEAAEEIARQLRLRNLSGMILVDFINMKDRESEEELLRSLRRLVRTDPVRTEVVDITALGLAEITRRKRRPPLAEQFAETSKLR